MAAKDLLHNAVRHALEKQGWRITDDPLMVTFGGTRLIIDFGAELVIAAEKEGSQIAVEIKSFVADSALSEFHAALGQFLNYQLVLEENKSNRVLYLGVPQGIYESFFSLPFTQAAIKRNKLNLLVYNILNEEVVLWIR